MGTRSGAQTRTADHAGITPALRWAIIGVTIIVAMGLTAAAWLLLGRPASPPVTTDATQPGSGAIRANDVPSGDAQRVPPQTGPSPGSTPVDGSEVLPPGASTTPTNRLPEVRQPTPRVATPLPASATQRGALVEGFPSDIAGPAPGDDVIESSIVSDGLTLQAALTARTEATPDMVTAYFGAAWNRSGLSPTGGDATAASDPFTSVTLAVAATGTGTIYTVFATLRTE